MTQETHHLHWTSNFLFSPYFFVNACVLFSPHQEPKNHRCLFRTIWRFPVAAAVGSPTSRRQVSLRRCGRWCGRRCPGDPPGALGGKVVVVVLRMEVDDGSWCFFSYFWLVWKGGCLLLLVRMLCNFSWGEVVVEKVYVIVWNLCLCFLLGALVVEEPGGGKWNKRVKF